MRCCICGQDMTGKPVMQDRMTGVVYCQTDSEYFYSLKDPRAFASCESCGFKYSNAYSLFAKDVTSRCPNCQANYHPQPAGGTQDTDQRLLASAKSGDTAAVLASLAAGANVNATGENGGTALLLAALAGHTEAVRALLAAGARLDAKTEDGSTALICAASAGNSETVRALLAAGADANARGDWGRTALFYAAGAEVIRLLCSAGADVNAVDKEGWTPLISVARNANAETIQALVTAGANINARAPGRITALKQARGGVFGREPSSNSEEVVALLKKLGARED